MKPFKNGKNIKIRILIWHMVDKMVKKQGRARFSLSCSYFWHYYIIFSENVKEPSHFSMLKSRLWHNKTETKKCIKVVKMVEFIKTCNQYPHKFNFCRFFSSITLSPLCWVKNRFSENPVCRKLVISFCLGERFA